jgi:hypothetical protein
MKTTDPMLGGSYPGVVETQRNRKIYTTCANASRGSHLKSQGAWGHLPKEGGFSEEGDFRWLQVHRQRRGKGILGRCTLGDSLACSGLGPIVGVPGQKQGWQSTLGMRALSVEVFSDGHCQEGTSLLLGVWGWEPPQGSSAGPNPVPNLFSL